LCVASHKGEKERKNKKENERARGEKGREREKKRRKEKKKENPYAPYVHTSFFQEAPLAQLAAGVARGC
jgi:hypothetical protein